MPALLLFQLDDMRLGLRLGDIERVERAAWAEPLPGAPGAVVGVINARGLLLPVVDLRGALGLDRRPIRPSDAFVIALAGRRTVAVLADRVEGIRHYGDGELAAAESVVPISGSIDGVLRLPDGLILVANLGALLSLDDERALDRALEGA